MSVEKLKKSSQFSEVYKKGKSNATRLVVLYQLENGLGFNRVGYSVSKKVGNSVVRNRAKRLIKEAYRLNQVKQTKSYDLVFIARVRMNTAEYLEVEKSVKRLLKDLK